MESKTVETNNRQVIEKVFEDFYLLIMKDPYMASFIKTHQGISNLVIAQSDYLYNALYSVDSTQVFADYKRLADIHWKIHLDETYLYKMIDYIQDQLIQKIRNQQIDLTARKVESVLNNIKQSTAYSYIFGSIEDTLSTLTPSTELSKIHIDWLIQLSHYLSSQHQWSEDTSTEESGMPITDFSLCRLGKKLSTIQFEITGHSNRSLQIKIEMLHKEIHDIGVLAINYFEKKDFTNALNMIRSLLRNTSILTSLLEQFDYHWKNKKTQILVGYIADKTHQGGLLNISSKSQDEHHQAIYDNIYQQITETIIEQLNNESATFAFTIKKHLYIYIDNKNTKHEVQLELIERIKKIAKDISAQYESITSCSFLNIGYIDTSLLHNLLEDEIHEVIRVIEHKTNHLNLHSQELVNIYDFGQDVRAIISEIQENLSLKSAVIHSIENHAVELYFHSIVNVNDSNLFGAETLARIPHGPNGQLIPAGMFIDIVNDYGLYQKFDMVVIQKIRNHLKEVSKKLDYVFLNLNPLSLLSKSIIDNIKQLTIEAKQHNLNVVLELTEYTLTSKLDVLKQLQTDNFFVAVDDFGTGYTNFEIVKQLSEEKLISFLKIDGSLVRSICESETSASLLEVILLLGNKLNLSLVLEYIEDQKVVNKLIEMFDDIHSKENVYGQGWFFSKPETIKDFNI